MNSVHLFLISSGSIISLPFLFFLCPFWANDSLMSPIFLKRSLVFPLLLFSSSFMHSSLKKSFLSLLAALWNSAFSWIYLSLYPLLFTALLSSAICKAASDKHFAFLLFFFFVRVLFTASCTVSQTSACGSSGTVLPRSNPLNLFVASTVYSQGI